MTPEEKLNYPVSERTRFSVRVAIHDGASRIEWIRNCTSLAEAQVKYVTLRDASDMGASQFGQGEVFDEAGQHIARISYNGRLWGPMPWDSQKEPVAEAPCHQPMTVGQYALEMQRLSLNLDPEDIADIAGHDQDEERFEP